MLAGTGGSEEEGLSEGRASSGDYGLSDGGAPSGSEEQSGHDEEEGSSGGSERAGAEKGEVSGGSGASGPSSEGAESGRECLTADKGAQKHPFTVGEEGGGRGETKKEEGKGNAGGALGEGLPSVVYCTAGCGCGFSFIGRTCRNIVQGTRAF